MIISLTELPCGMQGLQGEKENCELLDFTLAHKFIYATIIRKHKYFFETTSDDQMDATILFSLQKQKKFEE